jgi:hypothetical protein
MSELKLLRTIIETLLQVDIKKKNRTRTLVEARYIYTKILRDRGHSCVSIGKELGKDHTTIVHYTKTINNLLGREVMLAEKYLLCKRAFNQEKPTQEEDISDKLLSLKNENERLISERKKFNVMYERYFRLIDVIKLIDQRTPKGSETTVYDKINKMFNGYDLKDLTHYERVKKMGGG